MTLRAMGVPSGMLGGEEWYEWGPGDRNPRLWLVRRADWSGFSDPWFNTAGETRVYGGGCGADAIDRSDEADDCCDEARCLSVRARFCALTKLTEPGKKSHVGEKTFERCRHHELCGTLVMSWIAGSCQKCLRTKLKIMCMLMKQERHLSQTAAPKRLIKNAGS
jgi:hypothetical protein